MGKSIVGAPAYNWDRIINSGGGGGSSAGGGTKVVTSLAQAYAIPLAEQYEGLTVYDTATDRDYVLLAPPASSPSNWIIKGDGDVEDSYRGTDGNFDNTIATQKCGTDQTILSASLPAMKKYKIIATADITIAFNLPVLGTSPLLSGMVWGLRAGSELTFYKTADGSAIDGEVN